MKRIKALSLWEPHASLIALGHKTIETRFWGTSYRGPLLICAAKRHCKEVRETIQAFQDQVWCLGQLCRTEPLLPRNFEPALGKAVAVCRLTDCRILAHTDFYAACVPDPTHRFGFFLEDVKAVIPFPVKGKQGFFWVEVEDELLEGLEGDDGKRRVE